MAANALPGLQARRRVALLLEEVHADSSTTTQTRKALALLNAKPSVDTYMWKAGWRLRSVFRAVKGRPVSPLPFVLVCPAFGVRLWMSRAAAPLGFRM